MVPKPGEERGEKREENNRFREHESPLPYLLSPLSHDRRPAWLE
jgi:hypothetical protein